MSKAHLQTTLGPAGDGDSMSAGLDPGAVLDPVETLENAVQVAEFANRELVATIREAHAGGLSLRAIAAVTGDSPETVRKIVRAG